MAVVGAGAVGTTLAARLAEGGHPVVVCGRTPLEQVELRDDRGTRALPVRWAAAPADVGVVPWVLLATKIQHTESALPWLAALSSPDTVVVAAQNGVDHRDRLSGVRADIVPALVYVNAERTGPGRATARYTERDLVVPDDGPGRAVADMFGAASVRTEVSADFRTAAWRKLLTNAVANPLSALTGRRLEVLHEPGMADLARDLLRETVAVGRAEGADLPDAVVEQTAAWLLALPEGATSSMLQDRLARRGLEYDGLTGTVVRLAARHGVDVPASRTVLTLLAALAPLPG